MLSPMSLQSELVAEASQSQARDVRSVEAVYGSTDFHWVGDGFYVSTYFPSAALRAERSSPFLLMDYGPAKHFPALAEGKRGVGWHPHRGFETVTLAWQGKVAHRDNAGHRGVIGPGDVQWMTAASGIFHEEYHEQEFTRSGGDLHMMQLWVNLPKKDKRQPPGYQSLPAKDIPVVALAAGVSVRVIAGEYAGERGPARTFTPITMLDVELNAGATLPLELPRDYNLLVVVAAGEVRAGAVSATGGQLMLFANDGESLELAASEKSHFIVLAGEPIDEPIVQYGPFVMNEVAEIQQAIHDLNRGGFGVIPEGE